MSEKQNESLSALMDGELDELALHRVLKDVESDSDMREKWSRYHMGREVMKGGQSDFLQLDISSQVSAAIANESMDNAASTTEKSWFKTVAGLGIAASVTFAVVLGARFNPLVETSGDQQLAGKTSVEIVKPETEPFKGPSLIAQSPAAVENLDEEQLQQAQERLNSYLKQHAQDSAFGQGRTAMPYARVVNFEESTKQKGNQ